MGAVVWRELLVMARRPALIIVTSLHVALLGGFLLVWHGGVPVMGGSNLYEQEQLFQWGVLAVLLPWVAVRCATADAGDSLVLLCALTALRPSSVVIAKMGSLASVLALIAVSGFPVAIVAQQMSAVPLSGAVLDLLALIGLPVWISAASMSWGLAVRGRLASWVALGASTGLVLLVLFHWPIAGVPTGSALALVGGAVAVAAATWTDGARRYCDG